MLFIEEWLRSILLKFEGKFSNVEHSKEFLDTVTKLNVLSKHVFQISLNSYKVLMNKIFAFLPSNLKRIR
jgi:hypothetical protein